MLEPPSPPPAWPGEVARLQAELTAAPRGPARDAARVALWRLLVEALARFVREHARRAGEPHDAAIEDIAVEKALEMLARAESGAWSTAGRAPGEIVRFVAQAARHGWLDHAARSRRVTRVGSEAELEALVGAGPASGGEGLSGRGSTAEGPVVARELAQALRACVARLPERERRVWFFRAYYEMSSRDIAGHPSVRLEAGHVDVVNQRARDSLRRCMRGKGHDLVTWPREAFVELWEVLEALAPSAGTPPAPADDARRTP